MCQKGFVNGDPGPAPRVRAARGGSCVVGGVGDSSRGCPANARGQTVFEGKPVIVETVFGEEGRCRVGGPE